MILGGKEYHAERDPASLRLGGGETGDCAAVASGIAGAGGAAKLQAVRDNPAGKLSLRGARKKSENTADHDPKTGEKAAFESFLGGKSAGEF